MVLTSVPPKPALLSAGIQRRPLTSTSVRWLPRPRRSMVAKPAPGLFDWLEAPGTTWGSWFSTRSTVRLPENSNSSESTMAIGLLATRSRRGIREPVTITTSPSSSAAAAASLGAAGSSS